MSTTRLTLETDRDWNDPFFRTADGSYICLLGINKVISPPIPDRTQYIDICTARETPRYVGRNDFDLLPCFPYVDTGVPGLAGAIEFDLLDHLRRRYILGDRVVWLEYSGVANWGEE